MQKSRPLGITILALWTLAGSGIMIIWAAYILAYPQTDFVSTFQSLSRHVVVPLGAYFGPALVGSSIGIFTIPLAALYLVIGLLTFKVSKSAWIANVAFSLAAIISVTIGFSNFFYGYVQYDDNPSTVGLYSQEALMQNTIVHSIYFGLAAFRLYYLFRPSVREFFGTQLLFVQKQAE